jgi:hypothetical protein
MSKAVFQNSRSSSGDPVKLHKKPDECRKQLEEAFLRKVVTLPSGEMAILMILPHAKNGPLGVQTHNITLGQVAAMLKALNKRLPYTQQRLERWVEQALEQVTERRHRRKRKRKQLQSGEGSCGRHQRTAPAGCCTA